MSALLMTSTDLFFWKQVGAHLPTLPCSVSHKQQALQVAISKKDTIIALLDLSSSKRKMVHKGVMGLKSEKGQLMH